MIIYVLNGIDNKYFNNKLNVNWNLVAKNCFSADTCGMFVFSVENWKESKTCGNLY